VTSGGDMSKDSASEDDENGISLRLGAQRALLGNVPHSLRSASVEYRGTDIACCFVFDGDPTEDDKDLLNCAATEILADYREPYTISEEYLAIPAPIKAPCLRYIVFKRHETSVAT
jgi:hypothetical protein